MNNACRQLHKKTPEDIIRVRCSTCSQFVHPDTPFLLLKKQMDSSTSLQTPACLDFWLDNSYFMQCLNQSKQVGLWGYLQWDRYALESRQNETWFLPRKKTIVTLWKVFVIKTLNRWGFWSVILWHSRKWQELLGMFVQQALVWTHS